MSRAEGGFVVWRALLDWVYPIRCVGCEGFGEGAFCPACVTAVAAVPLPACDRCHSPGVSGDCPSCRTRPPAFRLARSAALFEGPLRNAVHALKYNGREAIAEPLAALMATAFEREPGLQGADLLVPLPLHEKRLRERGYNQSALLARALGRRLSLPVSEDALIRAVYRRPQVGLGQAERRENVVDAFRVVAPAAVAGRRLILVDDVMTTGATCHEAARALLEAGAADVRVFTLARESFRGEPVPL